MLCAIGFPEGENVVELVVLRRGSKRSSRSASVELSERGRMRRRETDHSSRKMTVRVKGVDHLPEVVDRDV
jgi:hypothetical protein